MTAEDLLKPENDDTILQLEQLIDNQSAFIMAGKESSFITPDLFIGRLPMTVISFKSPTFGNNSKVSQSVRMRESGLTTNLSPVLPEERALLNKVKELKAKGSQMLN